MVQLPSKVVSSTRSQTPPGSFPRLKGNFTHPSSTMFNLHTWTLLGIEDRDSLSVLPAFWISWYGLQRVLSTTESGTHSVLGVQRQIDPVSISLGDLGDLLLFLFEVLNLAVSTMRVYKAAILSVLVPRQIFTPA